MGVDGLHRLLKGIGKPRTLADLKGLTLGVDGYAWLHRAAVSCAHELLRNVDTLKLVEWFDRRVRLYESAGVTLYFVFDGAPLPTKARVEQARAVARAAAQADAATGDHRAAVRALDVSSQHAIQVIAYLKARGISFVVAPYEADPQLVFLEKEGLIDAIVSEDGDLLVFGAHRLLTKSDSSGGCIEISAADFSQSPLRKAIAAGPTSPSPQEWTRVLRALAILSGCDYSPGVAGVGPVKALELVRRHGDAKTAATCLSLLNQVDAQFASTAHASELAFLYQRVWDPTKHMLSTLNPVPSDIELDDAVVGPTLTPKIATWVCRARICPSTHRELIVSTLVAQYCRKQQLVAQPRASLGRRPAVTSRISALGESSGGALQASPFFSQKRHPVAAQTLAPLPGNSSPKISRASPVRAPQARVPLAQITNQAPRNLFEPGRKLSSKREAESPSRVKKYAARTPVVSKAPILETSPASSYHSGSGPEAKSTSTSRALDLSQFAYKSM